MDTKFQTSFIPKSGNSASYTEKEPVSILVIVGVTIFSMVLVFYLVLLGYQYYLEKQIEKKSIQLSEVSSLDSVNFLIDYDNKIKQEELLLDQHIAISPFIKFLSDNTYKSIKYTDFKYSVNDTGEPTVFIGGIAQSYENIYAQSKKFEEIQGLEKLDYKSPRIKSFVFSNFVQSEKGEVSFRLKIITDFNSVFYKNTLSMGKNISDSVLSLNINKN